MQQIKIEWLTDEYECDTCGSSFATGALVTMPDKTIINMSPHAHCFNVTSYYETEVYDAILNHLGYEVVGT